MSEQPDINVPADNAVFLAVSAGNYHDADLAFWKVMGQVEGQTLTAGQQAHIDQLRQRRKDTYADLVAWVNLVEYDREKYERRREATPVTWSDRQEEIGL